MDASAGNIATSTCGKRGKPGVEPPSYRLVTVLPPELQLYVTEGALIFCSNFNLFPILSFCV